MTDRLNSRRSFMRQFSFGSTALLLGLNRAGAESGSAVAPAPEFLQAGSKGYAEACQLFNSRLKLRPSMVARCRTEQDVAAAVSRAAAKRLQITVKSGGHSFEGFSSNNGGMMLDLSEMKALSYDAERDLLIAQPGCRLGEVGDFLFPKGRLLPSGSCAGVGIAGLTLGGGYGLFSRKFGLTCDHLTGLRMVDGAGKVHDSDQHPELLKTSRGGGNGNFGIVTELRFRTVVAPKTFRSQRIRYRQLSPARAAELCSAWFTATQKLPGDVFSAFVLNGSSLTILVTFFESGSQAMVKKAFATLSKQAWKAEPVHIAPTQQAIRRYYGRPGPLPFKNASAGYYKSYQDIASVMPKLAAQVAKVSGTVWQVNTLGGRINRRDYAAESVYPHRSYPWLGEIQGYWQQASRAAACIKNVQAVQSILADAGIDKHYRNYPDIDFANWESAYYSEESLRMIREMKRRYDPENVIRHPQSPRLAEASE
ncbi:FAD-binding oxidoreductase [Verrucomicrobiaceae bacterium R5-34]|nr:FAD-binding oxidoreductase [Verrucomicrobiaceae bacterium R5-34]